MEEPAPVEPVKEAITSPVEKESVPLETDDGKKLEEESTPALASEYDRNQFLATDFPVTSFLSDLAQALTVKLQVQSKTLIFHRCCHRLH